MTPSIRAVVLAGFASASALVLAAASGTPDARADDRAEARREGTDRTPSDVHRYVLRPVDDGTFLYDGLGFSAVIERDGSVVFHPEHWSPRTRIGEIITGTGSGRGPETWPVPLPSGYRPTPYDDRERQLNAVTPTIPVAAPIFVDAGGRFDLSDEYARKMGADPYRDAKVAFLSDTFDFRTKLAARWHREATAAALDELPDRLNVIWTASGLSAAERQRVIHLLWEET